MALENSTRIIQQRDTKANIEAFSGTLEEGAIGYATDTEQVGLYTNGSWVWLSPSISIDDLADVITTTPATGETLIFNGTNWVNGESVGSGEILVSDDTPLEMLTNEAEDDYLYEG